MKRYAILMLMVILISCKRGPQSAMKLAQMNFEISERAQATFPNEKPRTVEIFSLKEIKVSNRSISDLQQRFGFKTSETKIQESPSHFWAQDGDWYFEVSKFSGQELVANLDKYRKQLREIRWTLKDETLKTIAKEYIAKRAAVNMKEVSEEPEIRYTTASVGETKDTIILEEDIIEADIIFTRKLNGIPVIGPGSKLVVTISADGSVSGFYKIWREIDLDKKTVRVTTISSVDAIEQLIKKTTKFKESKDVSRIRLDIAAFGYWASPRHWSQKTLLPAHNFVYSVRDERGLVVSKAREELMKAYEGERIDDLAGYNGLKKEQVPIDPDKRMSTDERMKVERKEKKPEN